MTCCNDGQVVVSIVRQIMPPVMLTEIMMHWQRLDQLLGCSGVAIHEKLCGGKLPPNRNDCGCCHCGCYGRQKCTGACILIKIWKFCIACHQTRLSRGAKCHPMWQTPCSCSLSFHFTWLPRLSLTWSSICITGWLLTHLLTIHWVHRKSIVALTHTSLQ